MPPLLGLLCGRSASALSVSPPLASPLLSACASAWAVVLGEGLGPGLPACHRSVRTNTSACIAPPGFPARALLGFALSGDPAVLSVAWCSRLPASAFCAGSSGVLVEDVDLLAAAGLSCSAVPAASAPATPPARSFPPAAPASGASIAFFVVGLLGLASAAAAVAALVLGPCSARERSERSRPMLADSLPSLYG